MKAEDLESRPLGQFFRHAVLRTAEGRIWLASSLAYAALALDGLVKAEAVMPRPELQWGFVLVALLWPVVSFVAFLMACSPHYKTTLSGVVVSGAFSFAGFAILY